MRNRDGTLKLNSRGIIAIITMMAIVTMFAIGCATMKRTAPSDDLIRFTGTWSWGSPRRSAEVPFLKITKSDSALVIKTKHYMHSYFVGDTKDIIVERNHLEFAYWYAPMCRWAKCSLDLAGDRMNGECEGELKAMQWGEVPSYLWRQKSSEIQN